MYAYTNVVHEHHEMSFINITCEITAGKKGGNRLEAICMRVSLCCKATLAYQETQFCFSFVQFTNCDVPSLLALLKAIMVYVRFHGFYRYLSSEINAALE